MDRIYEYKHRSDLLGCGISGTMTATCQEKPEATTAKPGDVFTDVLVAVHGIGEQARFATVRSVTERIARSDLFQSNGKGTPIPIQPLGYFHGEMKKLTSLIQLDDADTLKDSDLARIGFAEVYWADIPDEVLKEGKTMEETKAWARTVVARADALCTKSAQKDPEESIVPPDFDHAGDVLDEIIDTVRVLENLFFLAEKAGLFKFDLRQILMEYLGDVQLVTEFAYHRKNIVGRFHHAMQQIYEQCQKTCPKVRIHIVAHSEGTVISFLGLLWAMSKKTFIPEDPPTALEVKEGKEEFPPWLEHVHGFMTIGSPIDKHLLLWRRLWTSLDPKRVQEHKSFQAGQIRWRNYYDYGDPVGFKLDSARLWLKEVVGCTAFEFCGCEECHHDIGFARYLLPGEAHNEYWKDPAVFKHFILDVVKNKSNDASGSGPQAPVPKTKKPVALVSPVLPYVLSLVLIALGVCILFKAVYSYTHPNLDPLQKFVRFSQLGAQVSGELSGGTIFRAVMGITALIAGAIILARVPHLAMTWPWTRTRRVIRRFLDKAADNKRVKPLIDSFRQKGETCRKAALKSPIRMWTLVGFAGFLVGFALYAIVAPRAVRDEIGSQFSFLQPLSPEGWAPTLGVVLVAGLVAVFSELLVVKRRGPTDTPKRSSWRRSWIFQGLHPFIVLGALAVFVIAIIQLQPRTVQTLGLTPEELSSLKPLEIKMLQDARFSSNELAQVKEARGTNWLATIKRVEPVLAVDPPVWPVILAGAAFLYLWWLATLVFDLAFIWQRYVRHSITNDRLREWNPYGFDRRYKTGKEQCCNVLKGKARPGSPR